MMKLRMIGGFCLALLVISQASAQPPEGGARRGGPPGGAGGGAPMSRPLFDALDTDHDGELSADEIKKSPESLATLDKNKDGKITEDEIRPTMPAGGGGRGPGGENPGGRGRPGGEGGAAGQGPNPERMVTHAMEFDADADGKLSKEELEKFVETFIRMRPGQGGERRGPGGPGGAGGPGGGPGGPSGSESDARPERPKRPE